MAPDPLLKGSGAKATNGFEPYGFSLSHILIGGLVCVLVLSVTYNRTIIYLRRRKFKREHGCQPMLKRVPHKDPLGLLAMLDGIKAKNEHKLLETTCTKSRELGTTFSSFFLNKNVIVTLDPENIKTILSLRFNDFGIGNRQETLGALLGKGIFTTDGQQWAHSRAMIRPNFTRDQVADLAAFERHVQELFRVIPRDGSTVDLQELFFMFTIDSATEFLCGRSTNTLKSRRTSEGAEEARFAAAFNKAQDYCANRDRWAIFQYFIRDSAGEEAIKICHNFVDQYVDEAIAYRNDIEKQGASAEDKYVFLREMAKSTTDRTQLRDELLNVLLAGRDTTASLLSNMWFILAKNPKIYEKVRKEVVETLQGELPSYEQLRNLKYLKYCMNEC
jgi:cytochrome P450